MLEFWCGKLTADGLAAPELSRRWYTKDPDFDREIRERFGALHACLLAGERPTWTLAPRGLAMAVIVLDQFSRNMFRGTPGMFAADPRALALSLEAVALGYDRTEPAALRSFLYMPFMHSEDARMQRRSVELFAAFADQAEAPGVRSFALGGLRYAEQHRDIVLRFGRFPHRNAVLGRVSSAEEEAFRSQPGSSF